MCMYRLITDTVCKLIRLHSAILIIFHLHSLRYGHKSSLITDLDHICDLTFNSVVDKSSSEKIYRIQKFLNMKIPIILSALVFSSAFVPSLADTKDARKCLKSLN